MTVGTPNFVAEQRALYKATHAQDAARNAHAVQLDADVAAHALATQAVEDENVAVQFSGVHVVARQ